MSLSHSFFVLFSGCIQSFIIEGFLYDTKGILPHIDAIISSFLLNPLIDGSVDSISTTNDAVGIIVTVDSPFNKNPTVNITRTAPLRQYFGKNKESTICARSLHQSLIERYVYATGSGRGTVGTPRRFVYDVLLYSIKSFYRIHLYDVILHIQTNCSTKS